jgi:hypothetical protein
MKVHELISLLFAGERPDGFLNYVVVIPFPGHQTVTEQLEYCQKIEVDEDEREVILR